MVDAAKGLIAPDVVGSLMFAVSAYGVHDYSQSSEKLIGWKRAFEKELKRHAFPFYCDQLGYDYACYSHYPRGRGLSSEEWSVYGAVGAEVSRRLDWPVVWGALGAPWLWLLAAELRARDV